MARGFRVCLACTLDVVGLCSYIAHVANVCYAFFVCMRHNSRTCPGYG
jgi:hypothetical protein